MKKCSGLKELERRGINIFQLPNSTDCSNAKSQINVIKELAPILYIDADAAIFKMWHEHGFEVGLEALCESILMEIEAQHFYSKALDQDKEHRYRETWDAHLRSLKETFLEVGIVSLIWDREYYVENNFYYFWTGENPEEKISSSDYEELVMETRRKLRSNHFSSW